MLGNSNFNRIITVLLFLIVTMHGFGVAQPPISFFPHHVGDLWQYRFNANGALAWTERLDSMFVDTLGTEFIRFKRFYHDGNYTSIGWYALSDSNLVYADAIPRDPQDSVSILLYKLNAHLGEVWVVEFSSFQIAKVAGIDTLTIFGRRVPYKEIWYGYPGPGPTDTSWWNTRILASDFGLSDAQLEPMGPVALAGAFIGGVGWGVIVNISEPIEIPSGFLLEQNFPNPFNPTTKIRFSVPRRTGVKLAVYDLLGRQVQTLVDRVLPEGPHFAVWDASFHASGVYFYRLQTDQTTSTKRMLLQK